MRVVVIQTHESDAKRSVQVKESDGRKKKGTDETACSANELASYVLRLGFPASIFRPSGNAWIFSFLLPAR